MRERRLIWPWSSNGTILIKDNEETVHRILRTGDLSTFEKATPRPLVVSATPPPMDESTTTPPLEGNNSDSKSDFLLSDTDY